MKNFKISNLQQIYNDGKKFTTFDLSELTPDKLGGKSWQYCGTYSHDGHIKRARTIARYIKDGNIVIYVTTNETKQVC